MNASAAASTGRGLFLVGLLFFVLGIPSYFVQLQLGWIFMPWYIPIAASLGVLLMMFGLLQRFGILRCAILALLTPVCGFMWYMLLVGSKTPEYVGPAKAGQQIPEFSAALADGKTLTHRDLANGQAHVLVFNRGRW